MPQPDVQPRMALSDPSLGGADADPPHPLLSLPREDLDMITELVLRSGSLKALAEAYGVSYPTIRTRLDRVIERLQAVLEGKAPNPMGELLAGLVERGEMTPAGARAVQDLHKQLTTSAAARREGSDQ